MTIYDFKQKYQLGFTNNTPTYAVLLELASEMNNLPKKHYVDCGDLSREEFCEDFMSIRRVALDDIDFEKEYNCEWSHDNKAIRASNAIRKIAKRITGQKENV